MLKELDRIEQIITDLLLFARPQASRPAPTDLREIAGKVLDNLSRRFEDSGIEVVADLDEDLPPVMVDPDMVQQVVLNLAINAIQAMPEGGTLKVGAGLRRTRYKKAYVDLVVADSGSGIPDEVKEKIFDPFFTTRSMGTGLGLSISLQIAREHGGNLTARNLAQGGASFKLSLPAPAPEAEEAAECQVKLRIRIADDEELIRKSLVKLLRDEGHDVDAVGSAAEVLESVRQDPPHVLVLDLRLPDGSGLDLLPRLKGMAPQMKVVVITAFGDLPTAVEAMRQGATDFLKKPYEMHEMLLAVERLKAGIVQETQLDAFRRGELESFLKTRIVGRVTRHAADLGHGRQGGAERGDHGPDRRRERDRQGVGRADDPFPERARKDAALPRAQLLVVPGASSRERAVRA